MNARFRIGNTYEFNTPEYISTKPLVYKGYDRKIKIFLFTGVDGYLKQGCHITWLEKGLVTVKTEWNKKNKIVS